MAKMTKTEKKTLRAVRRDSRRKTAQGMGAITGALAALAIAAAILPEGRKAVKDIGDIVEK